MQNRTISKFLIARSSGDTTERNGSGTQLATVSSAANILGKQSPHCAYTNNILPAPMTGCMKFLALSPPTSSR